MVEASIHNYDKSLGRYLALIKGERTLDKKDRHKLIYAEPISKGKADLILEYIAQRGKLGKRHSTLEVDARFLRIAAQKLKGEFDFSQDNMDNLNALYDWAIGQESREVATINKLIKVFRAFGTWHYNRDPKNRVKIMRGHFPPSLCGWQLLQKNGSMRTEKGEARKRLLNDPDSRLTLADYRRLIRAAGSDQLRAYFALCADCGARGGESGALMVGDIRDNAIADPKRPFLAVHFRRTKTGSANTLPVLNCKPLVLRWIEKHPIVQKMRARGETDFSNVPLFINGRGACVKYNGIAKRRRTVFEAAGITKPSQTHHDRRSIAGIYAEHFSDKALDAWFSWNSGKMSSRYVKFATDQLWAQYLKFYNNPENILRNVECKKCGRIGMNGIEDYCECGSPFEAITVLAPKGSDTVRSAEKQDALMAALEALSRKVALLEVANQKVI
ncbi:MAG: tyrosine-type recombinase/integrase [Candidatus Diapherotrites archaeon]